VARRIWGGVEWRRRAAAGGVDEGESAAGPCLRRCAATPRGARARAHQRLCATTPVRRRAERCPRLGRQFKTAECGRMHPLLAPSQCGQRVEQDREKREEGREREERGRGQGGRAEAPGRRRLAGVPARTGRGSWAATVLWRSLAGRGRRQRGKKEEQSRREERAAGFGASCSVIRWRVKEWVRSFRCCALPKR